MNYRIFPLGENALTIEFGNKISVEINNRVLKLAQFFDENSFPGFIETVPAYCSLTVFFDVFLVRKSFPNSATAFEIVKLFIENVLSNLNELPGQSFRTVKIPICFENELAPDLEFIASEKKLSIKTIKEIFLKKTYRVFMLGFLPGFAYMGEIEREIAAPRKASPRLRIPAGSVGIAGRQTGIYSLESPGGWQIIGRTPLRLFTPERNVPTVLQAGDSVKFYEIDMESFSEIREKVSK